MSPEDLCEENTECELVSEEEAGAWLERNSILDPEGDFPVPLCVPGGSPEEDRASGEGGTLASVVATLSRLPPECGGLPKFQEKVAELDKRDGVGQAPPSSPPDDDRDQAVLRIVGE
jgi:hypothetical protein